MFISLLFFSFSVICLGGVVWMREYSREEGWGGKEGGGKTRCTKGAFDDSNSERAG